ncbi:MAG: ribosome silencing factor [Bacilli bacterium]
MYRASSLVKKLASDSYFHKGKDIKIFDVRDYTPLASFYLVISAVNARQIKGIQENIEKLIEKADGGKINHIEGRHGADWVVIDAGDIVVHIFSELERERVKFDEIYQECKLVEFKKEAKKTK